MFASAESEREAPSPAMTKKRKPPAPPPETIGDADLIDRLRRLEKACDFDTSVGFCKFIDIEPRRWYNVLNGLPLGKEIAFRLVQRVPGLTTDWLWFGNAGGLTVELARRLGVFDPPQKP
jgi:hypothetical protein